MGKISGFTLIEVLVSITILTFVLAIAIFSLRNVNILLEYIKSDDTQQFINFALLRDSINSIFFHVQENEKEINLEDKFRFYFYGKSDQIKFITTKPLFLKGKGQRLCIHYIFFKDGKLYLQEETLYNPKIDYKLPVIKLDVKKANVIINNISEFKIMYKIQNKWTDNIKNKIPQLIQITFKDEDGLKKSYYIKPRSNFYNKEKVTRYMYEPF